MNKLLLVVFSSIVLGGCTIKDFFIKPPAGLEIATAPVATVFLNGESQGETPYTNKALKPGNYTLKLIPVSDDSLPPYETQLELTSKASTIISHTFAKSELDASGYTLELQEDAGGLTYLSVISDPDTVNVTIDDKPSGFTPLAKVAMSPGSHKLVAASPGYLEQELSVNVVKGYNLIVNFKLASQTITLTPPEPATTAALASPTASPSATPSLTLTPDKPYVEIGETETGWLRVRKEGSATSEELGKANTGEKLKYLGETTELGWHQVEFEGSVGYVSARYVTLVK